MTICQRSVIVILALFSVELDGCTKLRENDEKDAEQQSVDTISGDDVSYNDARRSDSSGDKGRTGGTGGTDTTPSIVDEPPIEKGRQFTDDAQKDGSLDSTFDEFCRGVSGTSVCQGSVMHQCDGNGVSVRQVNCESDRHCQIGLSREQCAICLPGEYKCDETTLFKCDKDGGEFTVSEVCPNADLCNESAGACTNAACLLDTWNCRGDTLQKCSQDQSGFEDVTTCDPGMCDEEGGQCDVCVPGKSRCEGDQRLTCDEEGRAEVADACPTATPHCVEEGKCVSCLVDEDCAEQISGVCLENYCTDDNQCDVRYSEEGTDCGGSSSSMVCDGAGRCVRCVMTEDCNRGEICTSNSCSLATPVCTNNSSCSAPGAVCADGICYFPCTIAEGASDNGNCLAMPNYVSLCYSNRADTRRWNVPSKFCAYRCDTTPCPSGFECYSGEHQLYSGSTQSVSVKICVTKERLSL